MSPRRKFSLSIALLVVAAVAVAVGIVSLLASAGVLNIGSSSVSSGGTQNQGNALDCVSSDSDEIVVRRETLAFENTSTGVRDVLFNVTAAEAASSAKSPSAESKALPGEDGSGTLNIVANEVSTEVMKVENLKLANSTTGFSTGLSASTALAADYELTLPSSGPSDNQVMSFSSTGEAKFADLSSASQLTGAVTSNAAGVTTITDKAVTLAKMSDFGGTGRLLGSSSSSVAPAEIQLDSTLSITDSVLSASTPTNLTGAVTSSGLVTTIANGAITYDKIQNLSASSRLLGSGETGSGQPPSELTLGTGLSMTGSTIAFDGQTTIPLVTTALTAYTPGLTDAGKIIRTTSGSAVTFTVPTNATTAFPLGTQIHILQGGGGAVTVGGAGVTINSLNSNVATSGQYAQVMLYKSATDTWDLTGDLG